MKSFVALLVLCIGLASAAQEKEPMCPCPRIFLPVCGSDGVTYNNPCLLKCQQQANKDLTMAYHGNCKQQKMPCICTREYVPVCGSNGVTYSNKCMFKCHQSQDNGLTLAHNGKCASENEIQEDVCICTLEYAPVCGSDGVTYPNMCNLKCKQRNNNDLTMAYHGNCKQQKMPCICTREYFPVCGSNGVTYSNKCMFKCQQSQDNGLKLEHNGACNL